MYDALLVVLTIQEQVHYANSWERCSVTLILIFNFTYSQWQTTERASLVTVTSTCEQYKDTLISAITAIIKHQFLARCQGNFLEAKQESLKANEVFFLGILLKITSALCKMKSKVTIGVKNTSSTPLVYILLMVMEIFHTILFISSLMITTTNFDYKIQTILVDYFKENPPNYGLDLLFF